MSVLAGLLCIELIPDHNIIVTMLAGTKIPLGLVQLVL